MAPLKTAYSYIPRKPWITASVIWLYLSLVSLRPVSKCLRLSPLCLYMSPNVSVREPGDRSCLQMSPLYLQMSPVCHSVSPLSLQMSLLQVETDKRQNGDNRRQCLFFSPRQNPSQCSTRGMCGILPVTVLGQIFRVFLTPFNTAFEEGWSLTPFIWLSCGCWHSLNLSRAASWFWHSLDLSRLPLYNKKFITTQNDNLINIDSKMRDCTISK